MSATLTWKNSGFNTKTGTDAASLITDIVAAVNANSGDSSFKWEIASSNNSSSPYYVVFKRKNASDGRILFVLYTSVPTYKHETLFTGNLTANYGYISYFPNGNTDTPLNLEAETGTILGDDTDALYAVHCYPIANFYPADYKFYYFDSSEALLLCFANPAYYTIRAVWAGDLVVDGSDNAYPAVFGSGNKDLHFWAIATSNSPLDWRADAFSSTSANAALLVNYGGNNKSYFHAFLASGNWAQQYAANSILINTGTSEAWWVPTQLLGQTVGEGFALKWRQIAFGPPTTTPFVVYESVGPVTEAQALSGYSAGSTATPWITDFKL